MSLRLKVQIQPNARQNEYVGFIAEVLKIKIKAPPVDGAANEELIRFLSETLNLPRRSFNLRSGSTSRTKLIEIDTAETEAELLQKIRSYLSSFHAN